MEDRRLHARLFGIEALTNALGSLEGLELSDSDRNDAIDRLHAVAARLIEAADELVSGQPAIVVLPAEGFDFAFAGLLASGPDDEMVH